MSPKFEIVLRGAQFKPRDKLDALELLIAHVSFIKKKFEYDSSGVVSGADLQNNEEEL